LPHEKAKRMPCQTSPGRRLQKSMLGMLSIPVVPLRSFLNVNPPLKYAKVRTIMIISITVPKLIPPRHTTEVGQMNVNTV